MFTVASHTPAKLRSIPAALPLLAAFSGLSLNVFAHDDPNNHDNAIAAGQSATTTGQATYLGNEGVMVRQGSATILFDPLFDNTYNRYEQVPDELRQNLLQAKPPFDDVDVVFISHFHGDHFSPTLMLDYLIRQTSISLVAPAQAVAALRSEGKFSKTLDERIHSLDISTADSPTNLSVGGLQVDAARIPHSGWPERMTDVQNLAYRVTFPDASTVLHMGDADTRDEHFAAHADHWSARTIHMAFPPYWYFSSMKGQQVLKQRLKPILAVGVHVPESFADDPLRHPPEFSGYDLFTVPGETRQLPPAHAPGVK